MRLSPDFMPHPGSWLRSEIVEPNRLTVTEAARHLGVTRQAMSSLLNARAGLSADMAIRFEKAFGVKAETLLRMQTAYELAHVRAVDRLEDIGLAERVRERSGERPVHVTLNEL